MGYAFAPPSLTPTFWQDELEKQIRALPGVHFHETTAHGSKIFKAGSYRFVVPRGGDRHVREGAFRDFEAIKRRYLNGREHEFGTHPDDVERMRPVEPEGARLDPAVRVVRHPALTRDPVPAFNTPRTADELADAHEYTRTRTEEPLETTTEPAAPAAVAPGAVEPPPTNDTHEETEPMATRRGGMKKGTKLTFVVCPVAGCGKPAQGRHLASHKTRGELPADFKMPRTKKARAAYLAERGGNGAGPTTREAARERTHASRRGSRATTDAMGASVRSYYHQIAEGGKEVGRRITSLQEALTELYDGPIKALCEFADTLHVENTDTRRQLAAMRMNIEKAASAGAALAALANTEPTSVVAKLRR